MVTPHVGVWIETKRYWDEALNAAVTPHVGVWIETSFRFTKTSGP